MAPPPPSLSQSTPHTSTPTPTPTPTPKQRYSWFLPYLSTRPRPRNTSMDNEQATFWLGQFIGRTLRVHASDGRVFAGTFKCTDKDRNIILALAHEYRAPPQPTIRKALETAGSEKANVTWDSRYVGLVVVPGMHVRKVEFEEPRGIGAASGVVI